MSFRVIAKCALLLVIIGFFMPVACDRTGFQIADFYMNRDNPINGILMYVTFISAVVGLAIGVMLIMGKRLGSNIDWIVIIVCIISGLTVYFSTALSDHNIRLQTGAYLILAGWIAALAAQIFSMLKRE